MDTINTYHLLLDCVYLHSILELIYLIFLTTSELQQVFGAFAGDLKLFYLIDFFVCIFGDLVRELFDCFFLFCRCDFGV